MNYFGKSQSSQVDALLFIKPETFWTVGQPSWHSNNFGQFEQSYPLFVILPKSGLNPCTVITPEQHKMLLSRPKGSLVQKHAPTWWITFQRTQVVSIFLWHHGRINALPYSIYHEWGWPFMTWDPYCTPPEVTSIAKLRQLRKHHAVNHPSFNIATPCLTSVISWELVYPKCYALSHI